MEAPRQRCILFAPAEYAPASAPPIFGLHLVERTALAFLRAGVREFLLVGDPEATRWIEEALATGDVARWVEVLNAAGVPTGPVLDLAQVFADPQVLAREMLVELPHPEVGTFKTTGLPVKLSRGDRAELAAAIGAYREGRAPLLVPLTLIRHHARRLAADDLLRQTYLAPHPAELMLRYHV